MSTHSGLIDAQIDHLTAKGMTFDKVIFSGGFSDSIVICNDIHARFTSHRFTVDSVFSQDPG
jgi:hypothetical protein